MNDLASPTETPANSQQHPAISALITWIATVGGWFIPGLGHLLLRKWARAGIIFVCVGAMAIAGYKMRGQVYRLRSDDIFAILNHLAEIGSGVFYFCASFFEPSGADTARAVGDLGTRFLDIAGLLNFLCVADAYLIARKFKS